ncbi:hypothetical protein [Prosthecobacter sp.]|uniref:hypothetical protein n=1 Tax=Prosthecobacter sp. TaxID=1965333 RepID=UPI0037837E87
MEDTLEDPQEACELLRTTSLEELKAAAELLKTAGIPHRLAGTKAGFDIMEVGRAGGPSDKLILVPREALSKASALMEESYGGLPLPEGHFLHDASDDEILEIIAAPEEWSFFDLAHARRIASERQLSAGDLEQKKVEHVDAVREGKPAPKMLLRLGWILALVGSGIGIILGIGIAISKEKTPHGVFYKYDEASRKSGTGMAQAGATMSLLVLLLLVVLNRVLR